MPLERDISRNLAAREGGGCEIKTPAGYIDVLTPSVLYEVKEARSWKGALGQVLSYGKYYPTHKLKLYLYGEATGKQKLLIKEQCAAHNVSVVWHREPAPDELPLPPKIIAPVANGIKLTLSALDSSYNIRAGFNVHLITPTAPIPRERLDAYMDEALGLFDVLLDNQFTLNLNYAFDGELLKLTRTRVDVGGDPVCYKLNLSIMTSKTLLISTSIPGVKKCTFWPTSSKRPRVCKDDLRS